MPLLTLLTDYGTDDYYVAAVKGTILRLAPGTTLVDVNHQVAPGDVATGAFLLAAAAPAFPEGTVHLAVIDPGVGSARRILVVRTPSAWLVAPDNGLLTPFLDEARAVRSVERSDIFLTGPGQTFHGRDRFAPIAAFLLRGETAEELGPEITDPLRLPVTLPQRSPGRITGRVAHIDRYGNLVTDIPADWLPDVPCRVGIGSHSVQARASHYAAIPSGEAALLTGSLDTLEISWNGEDLARRWRVRRGAAVNVIWNE